MLDRGRHVWRARRAWTWRSLVAATVAALPASWALNAVVPAAVAPTVARSLTADVAAPGSGAAPAAETTPLPRVTVIQAPASLTHATRSSRTGTAAAAARAAIPGPALAAYQRAATIINASDSGCSLGWELIAAIGKVESDHGRHGGSALAEVGLATPGIYGIPLDGRHGTRRIHDTDAGSYDHDTRWDRAVGPMQFIPSTWTVVGVDADGDGVRNPQDVDDAALATAVYLCSGDEDLSTGPGRDAAVLRYNHSARYVALVTAIAAGYARGDFGTTTVPASSAGLTPDAFEASTPGPITYPPTGHADAGRAQAGQVRTAQVGRDGTLLADPVDLPAQTPVGGQPTPTDQPSDQPTNPATGQPTPTPGPTPAPTPSPSPGPTPTTDPAPDPAALQQAKDHCTAQGLVDDPARSDDAFDTCVQEQLAARPSPTPAPTP
ncbi:lytic transglycosylase domain-containing protein [Nocardioides guangzhouensis]|uniref:lytic transglycosylase domain-containing protein n=1 Tax=Nocardioides guangzhouensis TaxID=2497878 RepID=UPI00158B5D16|nr:lytic murein transglycosylase [Nocardioides guangzhouensis]